MLDTALSILTSDVCIGIIGSASVFSLCKKVSHLPHHQPQPHHQHQPQEVSTWRCRDSPFFTLIQPAAGGPTLLFCHENETLYYASPGAHLSPSCPECTAFLCQFVIDGSDKDRSPRLLAFDILTSASVLERGDMLRRLSVHLPQPLCHVQWIGPREHLTPSFLSSLPHQVEGVFSLTQNPLKLGALTTPSQPQWA
jgi:hypothetical protein